MTQDIEKALKKAFSLGQTYWQQADSEYTSHWKKADVTRATFDQLVEDTCNSLAQPEPSAVWQPIETAPKETEVFIGAFIDGVFKFGRSEMFYEKANEFAGETWSGWVWSIDYCDDSVAENPTHWMPLPAPPQKETQ